MTDEPNLSVRAKLYQKIAALTAAMGRVPKNGHNSFFNYDYATESDVTDASRALLAEHGLCWLPVTTLSRELRLGPPKKNGDPDTITAQLFQFEIADTDTGETFAFSLWAEGIDGADKGCYKSLTGGVKYALMKAFLVSTGDDPEREAEATRPPARVPAKGSDAPHCPKHPKYPAKLNKAGDGWYCSSKATPAEGGNERGYCTWTAPRNGGLPEAQGLGKAEPPQSAAKMSPLVQAVLEVAHSLGWTDQELEDWAADNGFLVGRTLQPATLAAIRAIQAAEAAEPDSEPEQEELPF